MRFALFLLLITSTSLGQKLLCRETLKHVPISPAFSMENIHPFTGQGFAVVDTSAFLDAQVGRRIHDKMMEFFPVHNPAQGTFVEQMMSMHVGGKVSFHIRQKALGEKTLAEVGLDDLAPLFARHQEQLFLEMKANLPPEEAEALYLAHIELRWFRGEPEGESILGGHVDGGTETAFTTTTRLFGKGTLFQPGVLAGDFQEGFPIYEIPECHSLVLSVNRAAFYQMEPSESIPGLIPVLHERAPLDDKPRLVLVARYAYRKN